MTMRSRLVAFLLTFFGLMVCGHARANDWVNVSGVDLRAIRLSSILATGSVITYQLRVGQSAPLFIQVDVDCASRTYRETHPGSAPPNHWVRIDDAGDASKSELEFVCARTAKAAANSNAPQTAQAPQPTPAPVAPPSYVPGAPRAEKSPRRESKGGSSGSGFVVALARVVTNHHVVDGCRNVSIRFGELVLPAQVIARTARNDLALLAASQTFGIPVTVRSSAALGEDVTVSGFPLSGLLSADLIVTSGQINSLAGLGNDPTMVQISAPVQPGNSGGPLLDRSGSLVGVVVSKLNVARLAQITGDMAQNVNFAIKPEVLRLFLDANRVQYRTTPRGERLDGTVLAERARQFTVQVLCEE